MKTDLNKLAMQPYSRPGSFITNYLRESGEYPEKKTTMKMNAQTDSVNTSTIKTVFYPILCLMIGIKTVFYPIPGLMNAMKIDFYPIPGLMTTIKIDFYFIPSYYAHMHT